MTWLLRIFRRRLTVREPIKTALPSKWQVRMWKRERNKKGTN